MQTFFALKRKRNLYLIGAVMMFTASESLQSSSSPSCDTGLKTLTVCQVFADLPAHQGKIIAVRGIYFFGLRQQHCPQVFEAGNHKWPSALNLVDSNFPQQDEPPVGFATDEAGWNALQVLAISEGKQGRREEIWVTVVGQLQGPQRHASPGEASSVGAYGHLGVLAAQLVVKRICDIEIKRRPTFDYRQMVGPHL